MTCIVGMEFNGKVYIGGDIQGTGGNNKVIHTQPKVFSKRNIIFGYTTSYRFGQIIEHNLPDPVVPHEPSKIYRWLITGLIPSIKATLKECGYETGGSCLIGIKDQLWAMQDDFSVLRSTDQFSAVGSGAEYALGSLSAFLLSGPKSEESCMEMIKQAIIITSTFCPSVGGESIIIST